MMLLSYRDYRQLGRLGKHTAPPSRFARLSSRTSSVAATLLRRALALLDLRCAPASALSIFLF